MTQPAIKSSQALPSAEEASRGSTEVLPQVQPRAGDDEMEELRFTLRAARFIFRQIDRSLRTRPGYVSRNTWILEAIGEKLKREMMNEPR